jgi:hypothetical protein
VHRTKPECLTCTLSGCKHLPRSASRVSQVLYSKAISCLMECPQTEELACERAPANTSVPLSSPALHVLSVMSGDRQGLVFQEAAGRTLSKMKLLMLLRR